MDNTLTELLRAAEGVLPYKKVGLLHPRFYPEFKAWERLEKAIEQTRIDCQWPDAPDGAQFCQFSDGSVGVQCPPQPPADTVTTFRRTEAQLSAEIITLSDDGKDEWSKGFRYAFRYLGIIKPNPDPYQEHLSKHGLTDTVEARAMFDTFQGKA